MRYLWQRIIKSEGDTELPARTEIPIPAAMKTDIKTIAGFLETFPDARGRVFLRGWFLSSVIS